MSMFQIKIPASPHMNFPLASLISKADLDTETSIKVEKIQRYNSEMQRIIKGLYVSGLDVSQNRDFIFKNNITAVLNLCGDVCSLPKFPLLKNLIVNLKDAANQDILSVLFECIIFIDRTILEKGNVLVHCY